jgi:hypothetical protein
MKSCVMSAIAFVILLSCPQQGPYAQESGGRNCPIISVSCPEVSSAGQPRTYRVSIQGGDPVVKPTFKWTVSTGKITGGQGTREIMVDAEGSNSMTVTVEVTGYPTACQNKASCSWVFDRATARKVDEYGGLKLTDERARLDRFAAELQKEPNARGYIQVYAGRRLRRGEAKGRVERIKNYLVKERGLKEAQIVVVEGGRRPERAVELFIVPAGASPPVAAFDGSLLKRRVT